ncbi:putative EG45-like domain containing protein 1 isoform X2 [Tripterygium wilfordii]|uniref:Putative EG45-like domain containing protein 1 isoform X2 n=1 Tax=Tripterygium wilfordii TaxID=458696 RepID=A0A7J7DTJ6_TRIWF|nr:putative EG45-like domain containing protein 1 isoform X2 [Tripterygium wilfordii]
MEKIIVILVTIVATLITVASALPGTATMYTKYVPSACFGTEPKGDLVARVNDALWQNYTNCDTMIKVTCTGSKFGNPCTNQSVAVKVVDHCVGPKCPTLVLSKQAFTQIANPAAPMIQIDYRQCK